MRVFTMPVRSGPEQDSVHSTATSPRLLLDSFESPSPSSLAHGKSTQTPSARCSGMLVMIRYGIDVGFAIERLVSVFYEVAVQLAGNADHVHFSFSKVGSAHSRALPQTFKHIIEFDPQLPAPSAVSSLVQYIGRHGIDTVLALDLSANAHFLRQLRRAGIKRVFAYWGAPMSAINHGLKLFLKRLEIALVRRAKPDYFIFESRAMQDCAIFGRGIAQHRTAIVRTGVDATRFRRNPLLASLVYARFAIPKHRRIIVYMGHLHERKGVHVLMRAAVLLVNELRRDDIHILFLGNQNWESERFRSEWSDAASHVTFGGYHTDIPALLSGCYAGCIPSTGWDSFPMSSLEMQAASLPVLASDWQGVPETIVDGETGEVVPVGNAQRLAEAIAALVDDPARRDRMAAAARRRIEAELTRELQIENLVRCLDKRI